MQGTDSEDGGNTSAEERGDACYVCHDGGDIMLCEACPRGAHAACVGLDAVPEGEWLCSRCAEEQCGGCGRGPVPAEDSILCGTGEAGPKKKRGGWKPGCDRVFHLKCEEGGGAGGLRCLFYIVAGSTHTHTPPHPAGAHVDQVPEDDWFCDACTAQAVSKGIPLGGGGGRVPATRSGRRG